MPLFVEPKRKPSTKPPIGIRDIYRQPLTHADILRGKLHNGRLVVEPVMPGDFNDGSVVKTPGGVDHPLQATLFRVVRVPEGCQVEPGDFLTLMNAASDPASREMAFFYITEADIYQAWKPEDFV